MRTLTIVLAFLFTTQLLAVENELIFPTDVNRFSKAIAQLPDGGTIRIKPGQYEIDEPIVIDKNLTLIGIDGDPKNTVITAKDSHCLVLDGKSVKVSNLSFVVESGKGTPDKDSTHLHAVQVTGGKHALTKCRVSSDYGCGISAEGEETELTAERCVAFDSPWGGIDFTKKSGGKLTDCEVFGCTPTAIYVGSGKVNIAGCTVRDNKKDGIAFYGQSGVISKCQVYDNGDDGIYISGDNVESVTIDDCRVYSNKGDGLDIYSGEIKINNCSVYGNQGEQQLYFGKNVNVFAKKSNFYNGKNLGIGCSIASVGVFEDCNIYENSGNGFFAGCSRSKTTFKRCKIYRNSDGIQLAGAVTLEMEDCEVYRNGNIGIYLRDDEITATFDRCEIYNNDTQMQIQKGAAPVFRNCEIYGDQIVICHSGKGLFENCDIYGYEHAEIYIHNEADPVFRNCKIHRGNGDGNGILVWEQGKGTFENCEIYDYEYPAVGIKTGGNPTFKNCAFRNNSSSGGAVFVRENGRGTFEQNTFYNCRKMFDTDRTSRVTQRGNTMRGNVNEPQTPRDQPQSQTRQSSTADNRSRATQREYEKATDLVIAKHYNPSLRQEWQAMKSQYTFDPAFANAVEQVIRNPRTLRNFARIQERFTGNAINID